MRLQRGPNFGNRPTIRVKRLLKTTVGWLRNIIIWVLNIIYILLFPVCAVWSRITRTVFSVWVSMYVCVRAQEWREKKYTSFKTNYSRQSGTEVFCLNGSWNSSSRNHGVRRTTYYSCYNITMCVRAMCTFTHVYMDDFCEKGIKSIIVIVQ